MNNLFQVIRLKNNASFIREINQSNLDILNEMGQNLLHESIAFNNEEAALELINRGIKLDVQDKNGQTPLHFAADYEKIEICRAILKKDAEVNIKDKFGNNALWKAVFNGQRTKYYDIVNLLLEYGADANNVNNAGRTPIDFAKQVGYKDLVAILENKLKK